MTQRWKITIEYNGRNYHGFQIQKNDITIQAIIEKALFGFCQEKIKITVAGRTDAGVHAKGQVAHFDLGGARSKMSGFDITKAINAHMQSEEISVIHTEPVLSDFHARFGAKTKIYQYRIINRPSKMALEKGLAWHIRRKLDIKAMQEAAQILVGKHDYSSFRAADCQAKSPVKIIDSIEVYSNDIDKFGGREILITFTGQSFLHHQVRNIVGTLTLVGNGKWKIDDVKTALNKKSRDAAGPTSPSDGLYLISIDYD